MSKVSPTKSVVYLISRGESVKDNLGLRTAQSKALAHQLPLAVVWCVDPPVSAADLSAMKEVERELSDYRVPFMALLGQPDKTLDGLVFHVKATVFDASKRLPTAPKLQPHPYAWPGKVLPLEQLFIASGEALLNC